jgi:hypothetical protein
MKTFLGGRWFHNDNKVKEAINTWFALQVAPYYDAGIQKLVPRYDRCLNNGETMSTFFSSIAHRIFLSG